MSHGHWMVERFVLGQNVTFNMDTLVTMWAAMAFLLIMAYIATRNLSIFPSKIQLVFEKILGHYFRLTLYLPATAFISLPLPQTGCLPAVNKAFRCRKQGVCEGQTGNLREENCNTCNTLQHSIYIGGSEK